MLRVLPFLMLALLAASQAFAVELPRPRLEVLGFSPDGRFFAFRQSGLDVGNTHFAQLVVIDTLSRKPVNGTPILVREPASEKSLQDVRNQLDAESSRVLRRLGLNRALAGVAYVPRERNQMYLDLPWGERALLRLEERSGLAAPGCPINVPVEKGALAGFHLTLQRPAEVTVVHNDPIVPRERGCATQYRFASGFTKPRGNDTVLAAVIAYRQPTRNGDSMVRYMAVTSIVPARGGN